MNLGIKLSDKYFFMNPKYESKGHDSHLARKCIDRHVKAEGEIFLLGGSVNLEPDLPKEISKTLSNKKVTEVLSSQISFASLFTSESYINNQVVIKNDYFNDMVVSFKNGHEVKD